jgi:imidazole glycerol-phosphate synthase subunit HisF
MLRLTSHSDIKEKNVVKGMKFDGLRIVGKPDKMAQRYYEDGADELIFMDIVASLYGRNTILSTVSKVSKRAFIPLTVGWVCVQQTVLLIA